MRTPITLTHLVLVALVAAAAVPAAADGPFRCVGQAPAVDGSARPAALGASVGSEAAALLLFTGFAGTDQDVPAWSADIFDPQQPGSVAHFYETMSQGALRLRGQVADRRYLSRHAASSFVADTPTADGSYGRFVSEILRAADGDIDFTMFDNDGPDAQPNSGDDDGFVDLLFIVTPGLPANFLQGQATGSASLGLDAPFVTGDTGIDGDPILVRNTNGTIQQGRTYAETVGIIAHEMGHVLGLPDLFNVRFLARDEPGEPADDSAGIGHWGLMGWGALGWSGNGPPASLSAWSRLQLGWATAREPQGQSEIMQLRDIALAGDLFRIPMSSTQYFLLEYRKRSTFYDQGLPAEGLLIWSVRRDLRSIFVDLVCADGLWRDAGYPLGTQPDAIAGADNLDFWAHDSAYAERHAGNLGDATDVFDGIRFGSFTATGNPSSRGYDGAHAVSITDIEVTADQVQAAISLEPARIEFSRVIVEDENADGILVAGESGRVRYTPSNTGGVRISDVHVQLSATDSNVILGAQPEADFALEIDSALPVTQFTQGLAPTFQVPSDLVGSRELRLTLIATAEGRALGRHEFSHPAIGAVQRIDSVGVTDQDGNGDGHIDAGEFVRLHLRIAPVDLELLQAVHFTLQSLSPQAVRIGTGRLSFDGDPSGRPTSFGTPEFIVSSDVSAGDTLGFQLQATASHAVWHDTLWSVVRGGEDRTPPRTTLLRAQTVQQGLLLQVADRWIIDGSAIDLVQAQVYSGVDTQLVAQLYLELRDGTYEAAWDGPDGKYLVSAVVRDAAGNVSESHLVNAFISPRREDLGPGVAGADSWLPVQVAPAEPAVSVSASELAVAPDGATWYAATETGLWRFMDAGGSWIALPMMFAGRNHNMRIAVDPADPLTVTVSQLGYSHVTHDGGVNWVMVPAPQEQPTGRVLVDPVRSGRLYVSGRDRVLYTEDDGRSWQQFSVLGDVRWMTAHPAAPEQTWVYSALVDAAGFASRQLWGTNNNGISWTSHTLQGHRSEPVPDPFVPGGFYAIGADSSLLHSDDGGSTWEQRGRLESEVWQLYASFQPGQLFAVGNGPVLLSTDGGHVWSAGIHEVSHPRSIAAIAGVEGGLVAHHSGQVSISHDAGYTFRSLRLQQPFEVTSVLWYDHEIRLNASLYRLSSGRPIWTTFRQQANDWVALTDVDFSFLLPGPLDAVFQDPHHPLVMIASIAGSIGIYSRSDDGGRSWKDLPSKVRGWTTGSLPRAPVVVDPRHNGVYYRAHGVVERSADFGLTWEQIGPRQKDAAELGFHQRSAGGLVFDDQDRTLYAAMQDTLWVTQDDGDSWHSRRITAFGAALDLVQHGIQRQRFLVVSSWGVFMSDDSGRTWSQRLRAPSNWWLTARLKQDPSASDRLYLVTERELFVTEDGGDTWSALPSGIAGVPWFHDLAIDPLAADVLYVATTGGLFRVDAGVATAVTGTQGATPGALRLSQNYPNPFNAQTVIEYHLPAHGWVQLDIFDLLGQRVRRLVHHQHVAGHHTARWDARNDLAQPVASGVYFYRLRTQALSVTRKLVLTR